MSSVSCPFCDPQADAVFLRSELVLALWDRYPASPGHALIVPTRHVGTWSEVTGRERAALWDAIDDVCEFIRKGHSPHGFNVGMNLGAAAGQTVSHLHVHIIPRFDGDVIDPTGGIRSVIPGKANYRTSAEGIMRGAPHVRPLVRGEADPLLEHLVTHIERSAAVDIAVAFVLPSGLHRLEGPLIDLLAREGRLRLLTGDYLDVTEPEALRVLLDLASLAEGQVELRIFETKGTSFHPKTYLFRDLQGAGVAFVGSSNLSNTALGAGVEWNYRVVSSADREGFADIERSFDDLFRHRSTVALDHGWVDRYAKRRNPASPRPVEVVREKPEPPPTPHPVQQEALEALVRTREAGNRAGLVVLATGLGKTWLSAFDSGRPAFRRVLFVAHREEILGQAMATFRRIRPGSHLGIYTGKGKDPDADVLFASVQTLSRAAHLRSFEPTRFDYIVVDEFHHALARTYRKLIEYFDPKFLLGLTATPERTDGGDLLGLCGENLVFRCDLADGIRRGLLSPFHYFGVPDDVDYQNIPWRNNRFDPTELEQAVATQKRAQNALEQHRDKAGKRTLAFCCSKRHATFMAEYFRKAHLEVAAVHSGEDSDPRTKSLQDLQAGKLDVVFSVDMFNEGVDVPNIDTVMMLRPTESRILWLQQLGRGLRKMPGKPHLTVIDYIGNHRSFLLKPQVLFDLGTSDYEISQALRRYEAKELDLPPGCEVTYDLKAVAILKSLIPPGRAGEAIDRFYDDFRERTGARPMAAEVCREGYNPRVARKQHGAWFRFVQAKDGLDASEAAAYGEAAGFLDVLETTPMVKSYKMLVLASMLDQDRFPGEIGLAELREGVRRYCARNAKLANDLTCPIDDDAALDRLLVENPINAWAGGKGTGGTPYFEFAAGVLKTAIPCSPQNREALQSLTRELMDWRMTEYLRRDSSAGAVIKVNHVKGRPHLFPLDRDKHPDLPTGWVEVDVGGDLLQMDFVKVAVNVARRTEDGPNELPALLRKWFGPDAGLPGTSHYVEFEGKDGRYRLYPRGHSPDAPKPELWRRYAREQIPGLFGLVFNPAIWNSGFVTVPGHAFLLVTLEKKDLMSDFQYRDRFLSPTEFQWQSQNRTTQASKHGRLISQHASQGVDVHLFVRSEKKVVGRSAPFFYAGPVRFRDWSGEKPITVRWELSGAVPEGMREELRVPQSGSTL